MSKYSSTTSSTNNEKSEQEVELVYSNGLIRKLLKLPEKKEVYIGKGGTVWYEKGTGKRASTLKECEICDVVEYHRQIVNYPHQVNAF